jgi:hypothetical protein
MKQLLVVVVAALSLGFAVVVGWRIGDEPPSRGGVKLERIETSRAQADIAASRLVESLGRLCANFGFYFKHDMANGAFRPVRCSLMGQESTILFAYGFDSERTQQAWVSEWGKHIEGRGATLVEGGVWAVEVLEPDVVDDVRSVVREAT